MGCIARIALLVAFGGCFSDLTPQSPQPMTSPGPLFAAHAALECTSCHVDATADVDSNKCLSCHPVRVSPTRAAKPCEMCHRDHRGAGYDPRPR